ncbi:hypothetical protein Patl1_07817 [Pistacia atlantica]|uniref:Uncharacterized protein n=1 Tax=Pistacia atlantica TaxID=434234 RepID=A0ACC1AGB5_9ROSI|nr:hypothetical protein Patl1_07817 [Pistacia atlantica]
MSWQVCLSWQSVIMKMVLFQGYELLKTDDIFLLKGISEDGTPAFHPHVVQQNGLTVLRFLQENCKQDPGAYWLYKSAGEDVIQLFDLSVIPKNHTSGACEDSSSSIPLIHRRNKGLIIFFRNSPVPYCSQTFAFNADNRAKLMMLMKNPQIPISSFSEPVVLEMDSIVVDGEVSEDGMALQGLVSEASVKRTLEANVSAARKLIESGDLELRDQERDLSSSSSDEASIVCAMPPASTNVFQTVADPISSKLAAVHHVSQAIKSLRLMRKLQSSEPEIFLQGIGIDDVSPPLDFSVCACGDADCIEVCDIREWLPTSKLDHKLWKLVLLLGESYLALGQAHREDGQLHQGFEDCRISMFCLWFHASAS